jgi:hypothetical protein
MFVHYPIQKYSVHKDVTLRTNFEYPEIYVDDGFGLGAETGIFVKTLHLQ